MKYAPHIIALIILFGIVGEMDYQDQQKKPSSIATVTNG